MTYRKYDSLVFSLVTQQMVNMTLSCAYLAQANVNLMVSKTSEFESTNPLLEEHRQKHIVKALAYCSDHLHS